MKIYIAGPMRGYPDWNFAAFEKAEQFWQRGGHHVFSPMRLVKAMGYDINGSAEPDSKEGLDHLKHVMMSDIACIYASDGLALLPGWENSRGCTVELALAQFLGLEIFCAETGKKLNLLQKPWEFHRKIVHNIYREVKSKLEEMKNAPEIP